ncbi:DUF3108 domain-containing protein [Rhodoferax sp. U2-2l]|uniref:DUF3108 domain-containing protein n=1 Tax=Rhodoferax sp. U2-2l TaxID=2884000 RepID=UPI001D0BBCFF|nr:DUF3108 domain-containing protein [Rhodoferax sp. U2-2l]MCB8748792.1 DUF3108 domain-containing protein [Rhodoferax sp. U2-2l]
MATLPARSPRLLWLALGGLVLTAHLGLLQLMPVPMAATDAGTPTALRFATRAVVPEPAPPSPRPVAMPPPQAARKPVSRPPPAMAAPATLPAATAQSPEPQPHNPEPPQSPPPEPAAPPEPPASAPDPQTTLDTTASAAPTPTPAPAALPLPFRADRLIASTRLIYSLQTSKFPFPVQGELLWLNQGDTYSARLSYRAFGLSREQTSRGHITASGLAPERFSDKYRSELAAHFNYAENKISFSANTPDAVLLPGAQDRLSVLLQLGALLASAPERYPSGSTLSVPTTGPREADIWLFTLAAIEPLDVAGRALPAVKLERQPRRPYDQKVEVWLAPELGYLPARIRITEANGDHVDQVWVATEPAGP